MQDINCIGSVIGEINQVTTAVAAAIEEKGAATSEITRNVQQAASGTQDVASNIAPVSTAAGETGTAAHRVLGAATELSRQAERMRLEVAAFVSAVRAASSSDGMRSTSGADGQGIRHFCTSIGHRSILAPRSAGRPIA